MTGDPWGILAARAALTKPGGATQITAGVHDPQTVIDAGSAGTTYWFDGTFNMTYEIYPKDGDTLLSNNAKFIGNATYTSGSRYLDGSTVTGANSGIDLEAGGGKENVTIKGLEFCNYAQNGIKTWNGVELQYILVHDNLRNGLGGGHNRTAGYSPQVLMQDCLVYDNGSVTELGAGSGGTKFAGMGDGTDYEHSDPDEVRASTAGAGFIARRCYFYRNIGNGLWHDVGSGGSLVEDCIADSNSRKGFHNEIAVGPDVWQDNTSRYNGTWLYEDPRPSSDYGIVVMTSLNCTVQRNRIYDNASDNGIKIDEDGRVGVLGHNTDNILVQNNNLQGGDVYFKTNSVTGTVTASNNTDLGGLYGASYTGTFDPGAPILGFSSSATKFRFSANNAAWRFNS